MIYTLNLDFNIPAKGSSLPVINISQGDAGLSSLVTTLWEREGVLYELPEGCHIELEGVNADGAYVLFSSADGDPLSYADSVATYEITSDFTAVEGFLAARFKVVNADGTKRLAAAPFMVYCSEAMDVSGEQQSDYESAFARMMDAISDVTELIVPLMSANVRGGAKLGTGLEIIDGALCFSGEGVADAVDEWLDNHPEATTTVEDGSITKVKLATALADELDGKAHDSGIYPDLRVGLADNLVGRADPVDAEYLYRTSGGSADIADGDAVISEIRGNTIVWNQLCDPTLYGGNQASVTKSERTYTVTGTSTGTYFGMRLGGYYVAPATHKVVIVAKCSGSASVTNFSKFNTNLGSMNITGDGTLKAYATVGGSNTTVYLNANLSSSTTNTGSSFTVEDPMIFDLTAMFGAGNEPTLEQFEAMFPLDYYPYDAGSLLDVDMQGVETVGFNAYDSTTGKADLLGGHQYQITGTYTALSYSTGETLTPDGSGKFTPTDNGTLTVTGGAANTCVHLVLSGGRDGEYEPYWKNDKPISLGVFQGGKMRRAGTVYDELSDSEAVQRVGTVDLSTLSWSWQATWQAWYTNYNSAVYKPSSMSETANAKHAVYEATSYSNIIDGSVSGNYVGFVWTSSSDGSRIVVKNGSTSVTPTGTLEYQLATPVTTSFDPPLNLSYPVSDYGTERIIVDTTDPAPQSAPVPMSIIYSPNVADFVYNAPKNYISKASFDQFSAALGAAISKTITATWDSANNRYNFTVV